MDISDKRGQSELGLAESDYSRPSVGTRRGPVRLREPNRQQVLLRPIDLESLLPDEHPVREVWHFVCGLDLSGFTVGIKAVEGHAGRPATDPRILLSLWLYAISQGMGSAREIARLTTEHVAYQWLCGEVSVNHHSLSDFYVSKETALTQLLTDGVAALMEAGAVRLERVAQDGMRVRASAGASSFRRRARIEQCQREVRAQIETLRKELDGEADASRQRRINRQLATSKKRQQTVDRALEEMRKLELKRAQEPKRDHKKKNPDGDGKSGGSSKSNENSEPRASTTDPEARVMKMADGGFRPAYNAQLVTDSPSQVIVGVTVTNQGTDMGLLTPMMEDLKSRYGRPPKEALVDGGFASHDDIEELAKREKPTEVYAPVQKPRGGRDPFSARKGDSPEIAEWRARMGTPEAQAIYKQRGAIAECVNAIARNRGLTQFLVRGLEKVRCSLLFYAITHNMMRSFALTAA